MKNKLIQSLIGICTLISMLFGLFFFMDDRHALSKELDKSTKNIVSKIDKVAKKLDQKILRDDYRALRKRMWGLQEEFGQELKNASVEVRDEYNELKLEKEQIKHDLDSLRKK